MDAGYEIADETPSAEDYVRLRRITGLSPKSLEAAARGLPHTVFAVVVRHAGRVIGMGRLIGDHGLMFQVTDIAVDPGHQGKGLGKAIVSRIVAHIHANLPDGAYISLIADGMAAELYAQYGFTPTAPASVGMALHLRPLPRDSA